MNVRRTISHAPALLAAAALTVGLSSCNYDNPTDMVYNPAVGVNDQSGTVDVLNAVIVSGSEGSGVLIATLVNNDQESDDSLTGVSGDGDDQGVELGQSGSTAIEAGQLVNLAEEGPLDVSGEPVTSGAFVTLTFIFENSEAVTLDVPVVDDDGAYDGITTS